MLSKYDNRKQKVVHLAVNACLIPVCAVHGQAVTTVEGIGSTKTKLHPVQERIAKAHGSQCGFCTPGIVMSMYTLLRNKEILHYEDIETCFQGNLCRCTGYRPIIEGFKTFMTTDDITNRNRDPVTCQTGINCCRNKNKCEDIEDIEDGKQNLFDSSNFLPVEPSQEPIFPPELKLSRKFDDQCVVYKNSSLKWYRPSNFGMLLDLKEKYPNGKIIVGNTEVGVEVRSKKMSFNVYMIPHFIDELYALSAEKDHVAIGSAVSLSDLQCYLTKQMAINTYDKNKVFLAMNDLIHLFAGTQVRNVASIGGNIVTASPVSDMIPLLSACEAVLNICSKLNGLRKVCISDDFFLSYRKVALKPEEILVSIEIPRSNKNQYFRVFKQSKRRDDDISIVTGAFNVSFFDDTQKVRHIIIYFGGIGPTVFNARLTSEALIGREWDDSILTTVNDSLISEIKLNVSAPGGMIEYRKCLCLSMFFKFFIETKNELVLQTCFENKMIKIEEKKVVPKASQYFNQGNERADIVGKPLTHKSAFKQATGEALYCDDLPSYKDELFLSLVLSDKSNAKIISIDSSLAKKIDGVVDFFSADDITNINNKGFMDEEIFASEIVTSVGNVVGAIVAEDENISRKAVQFVKIDYEDIGQPIVSIEDAILRKSYYPGYPVTLKKGDVNHDFSYSQHLLEGYCRSGAQEHFYLETQSCLAVRKEDELEVFVSTQHPAEAAKLIASVLGIPNHKVCVKVKRIGGGFGGKETRTAMLYLPVAIAAYKLNRPVRSVMERNDDMQSTGQRHPHLIKYKVGFSNDGKITGAIFDIYNNAGCTLDLSAAVNERAMYSIDNCFQIPNITVNGYVCKTNLPSNTAFRGFGGPQAMLAVETMARDIAQKLNKSYEEIAELNMYKEGDLTHYNQNLVNCTIKQCWDECIRKSYYYKKKQEIELFNRKNRWQKKGLSIVSTKFGLSFGIDSMMQAGALVHIYLDGSVLITIGGIEMGQGLFTKMIQVASRALQIDTEKIHISETATDKVPNASPTAASTSSDLYGMAVLDACEILSQRLSSYKHSLKESTWEDWVSAAYADRVSLSANGFYASPLITYNKETNCGELYQYFTYGVGCSEVIIDCLTGNHQVLRTDIVMDLGESLNPAIDIGQIEGAFMQGYGFCTMEEMVYSPDGVVYSKGPGSYKIPGFGDIPKEFNVSLLKGTSNPRAVYSSKAVGEPPLFLASSVFFAIKEAISSARQDAGVNPHFHLDAPATCERIRMACVDDITTKVMKESNSDDKQQPWNVMA